MSDSVLVVEDDRTVAKAIRLTCMNHAGLAVLEAGSVAQAQELLRRHTPRLIILDLLLPNLDGLELCRSLRAEGKDIPIIVLTAKGDEVDKVIAFEVGVDDYVVKPFSPMELVGRIRAILRRSQPRPERPGKMTAGELTIDPGSHEAYVESKPVSLTHIEFNILLELFRQVGKVVPRDELVRLVWGYDSEGDDRLLDSHIRRIRTKIEADPDRPRRLLTVRSVGYKLVP